MNFGDHQVREDCNLCREVSLAIGEKGEYGAVVICQVGDVDNRWLATLSPKTGGKVDRDFSIQLMPIKHLTHFAELADYPDLAKNYGLIFAKISAAMTKIMVEETADFVVDEKLRPRAVSVATYGKCTNWQEKKEHLHIKIYPFRDEMSQPCVCDSSFGRLEVHKDAESGNEFVKFDPVRKNMLSEERFNYLGKRLMELLND
ncbi:MAG: hypothetical protein ABIH82_00455 [Candidatus Woesearchaeota archaeon]